MFGGNDCEARHDINDIISQYDSTIDMIKLVLGPDCSIFISSIPQRRRSSVRTHIKIAQLNESNADRHNPDYKIYYVDATPRFGSHFRDRVHMNYFGLKHWAEIMSDNLSKYSNFQGSSHELSQ